MEKWKDIEGYEGKYQISNKGRVKALNFRRTTKEKIISGRNNKGYQAVELWKFGKRKSYLVHRLVALSFVPNPDNLPQINHKDENKLNNNADNLEWCTQFYNNIYGTRLQRVSKTLSSRNIAG